MPDHDSADSAAGSTANPLLEMVLESMADYLDSDPSERHVAEGIRAMSALLLSYGPRRQLSLDSARDLTIFATANPPAGRKARAKEG
ncbi:MAG: hypothetical protein M1826_002508 [Phylliscum demangeonii]|nr:MAG: hypothetical protein M1826_002508 [Phylliscum demangeonii]